MGLEVGDRVVISSTSRYSGMNTLSNPTDTVGTVLEIRRNRALRFRVQWDNGYTNGYTLDDLVLVGGVKLWD